MAGIEIQPVILSGGSGTRLWPLSREDHPKPLLRLFGEHSLLQQTALRVGGRPPLVVCNEKHRFISAEQLREIGRAPGVVILEPVGRNTAPALAELSREIAAVVGFRGELVYDRFKPDGTPRKLLDVSRMAKLGWKAQTSLKAGLARTYEQYRDSLGRPA